MSNILEYMDWRGDLTVKNAPFNEVDNLILTQLSFMDLGGIAEGENLRKSISVREAVGQFLDKHRDKELYMGVLLPEVLPELFRKVAASRRFGDMRLLRFRSVLDTEHETQFAAVCIAIGDGSFYASFRGTDDTLVGWKEDFNMSFMDSVPAQILARDYLADAAKHIRGKIRVGGHSKGGNLALYSAANMSPRVQNRIIGVYNNDGPGFSKSITETDGFRAIEDKVRTIVPQFSVVGLLLEHGKVDKVVRSSGDGIWQHDPCTWEVLGCDFVEADGLSKESRGIEKTIKAWVAELTVEQRRDLVESVYKAFTANHAETLTDIAEDKLDFVRSLGKMDDKTRDIIFSTGKLLLREGFRTVQEGRAKKTKKAEPKEKKK